MATETHLAAPQLHVEPTASLLHDAYLRVHAVAHLHLSTPASSREP